LRLQQGHIGDRRERWFRPLNENEKMEQMLIIAGGVALGGIAVIYRKPIAVGFLGLIGFAVLLVLGLWAANPSPSRSSNT
jgi:hypothetical protein